MRLGFVSPWPVLPRELAALDVTDVAVGPDSTVYALTRQCPQVLVLNPDGGLIGTWGQGAFTTRPHGITVGPDGKVYVVDEGAHCIKLFNQAGDAKGVIGQGAPSDTGVAQAGTTTARLASIRRDGAGPFNRPTKLAISISGDLYVSDGYGNCKVHRYGPTGELISSWGRSGSGAGEFHLPHSVATTPDGTVLVADRENDRLQLFDIAGALVGMWTDMHRPASVAVDANGLVYIGELSVSAGRRSFVHGVAKQNLPARLSVFDPDGQLIERVTELPGTAEPAFTSPHGLAVSGDGSVYIAELANHALGRSASDPESGYGELPTLRKLVWA